MKYLRLFLSFIAVILIGPAGCNKKYAHQVHFEEFTLSEQSTYILKDYRPVDTAEYFVIFPGNLSEADLDGDLSIIFVSGQNREEQILPKNKMFESNWSNLEKQHALESRNLTFRVQFPDWTFQKNPAGEKASSFIQIRLNCKHSENISKILLLRIIRK